MKNRVAPWGVLFAILVPFVLAVRAPSAAGELDWKAPLPVDPAVHLGQLPNGFRYWIRQHATPPGKVGLWLHVGSGSINEEEDQRGLAHFLEHLAFDGSANFPPGTLVKYFESLGLRFGYHQNAFTSFDQTTYMIYLPDPKDETVAKGLQCLADFGFRLSLLPAEIDKERRVVLEETRARKGYRQRLIEKMLPLMLPGSRVAERLPIGKEEVVQAADPARLKAYYAKWYRPDDATLLLAGDLTPATAEQLVTAEFRQWAAAHPAPAGADPGVKPYTGLRAGVITDPEKPVAECMVLNVQPLRKTRTYGDFRTRLIEELGDWIVNRRLADLIQRGAAPFQNASVEVGSFLNTCTTLGANATGKPEQWAPMLKTLLTELKRACMHGFLPQEFDDARRDLVAGAEQAARTEATWDARVFLSRMNSAVAQGELPVSEAQRLKLLNAVLPSVSLADVSQAFRDNFGPDARLLLLVLPEKEGVKAPTQEEVLAAAREVAATDVPALTARARPKALLEHEPRSGAIEDSDLDEGLQVYTATFENGVRVHLRTMDFKKDQVFARLTLAGGALLETAATRGLAEVAALAFNQPASAQLSSIDIRDLLTGKNVSLSGWAGEDALNLRVSGSPQDLEEGFRLAYLLLTGGRLEESALKVWREQELQQIDARHKSVEAQLAEGLSRLLSGGDPRFAHLTREQAEARTLPEAQAFLSQQCASAPLEVAIVGDLPRERMLELAKAYFGSLPKRKTRDSNLERLRKLELPKGPQAATVEVATITPRANVVAGWRGANWRDVKKRRLLQIAAQILEARLREEIREKRGLTYSVWAMASAARAYPGTGCFAAQFTADPQKVAAAADLTRALIERFAQEGPTTEEMDTVRKQLHNQLETQLKEPSYWLDVLADLDYHGTKLSDVREVLPKMISYTGEDVRGALRDFVKEERRLQVIALPKPAP